ncbi:MAG: site-2 protease family protein [Candidatus Aureabacteria bacterium]|nr:site-2 protease family protein [Candidatus Auribacterota bacterium]
MKAIMPNLLLSLPILFFSVIVHEIAHGWVALRCGDPTARDAGRLTLNPLPHIDLFSTILLPVMCLISRMGFFIASARPIPVNANLLRGGERDHMKVTLAGPFSNLLLALAAFLSQREADGNIQGSAMEVAVLKSEPCGRGEYKIRPYGMTCKM